MDVIWNLTRACPWNCAICCVSNVYIYAAEYSVPSKVKEKELTLTEKSAILKILIDRNFEIIFSGGDPLYYDEDFQIVEEATRWLPPKKISVSMTGSRITETKLKLLKKVGVVEFTIDNLPNIKNPWRPREYNHASMVAIKKCIEAEINTRAITVLYPFTMTKKNLENIYRWLCENRVPEWKLLRFYPVGKATKFIKFTPSNLEYLKIMKFLRELHGFTRIFFQHSLEILEGTIKCSPAVRSLGILPDGTVVACAWAINENCQPYPEFRLGKLPEDNLNKILEKSIKIPEFYNETNFCWVITYSQKNKQK